VGISEREKEIKRRRHRRKKLAHFAKRLKEARPSERAVIIEKVRQLTPGADAVFANWEVDEQELQK
jgi:hypothetical protein